MVGVSAWEQVVDLGLKHYGRPQEAAQAICQASFDNESEDNITACVVEFSWNEHRAAEFVKRVQDEKVERSVID